MKVLQLETYTFVYTETSSTPPNLSRCHGNITNVILRVHGPAYIFVCQRETTDVVKAVRKRRNGNKKNE